MVFWDEDYIIQKALEQEFKESVNLEPVLSDDDFLNQLFLSECLEPLIRFKEAQKEATRRSKDEDGHYKNAVNYADFLEAASLFEWKEVTVGNRKGLAIGKIVLLYKQHEMKVVGEKMYKKLTADN